MEAIASESAIEDVINTMPDNVVTHILDRLPVQDAVKTGILSKKWRLKWTMLSELVFDGDFFLYLIKTKCVSKFGSIVSRLLMNIKGAITKFVLYIDEQCYSVMDNGDIAHWILFLSTKGVKDLTIKKPNGEPLMLPTHLFSCLELKHLKLFYCCFDPPVGFHGFPNLLTFESGLLYFESRRFEEFVSQCPLLEVLNMRYLRLFLDSLNTRYQRHLDLDEDMDMDILSVGKVKLVEHANLTRLSLSLCNTLMITNSSSILGLVSYLPNLQHLDLEFVRCKFTEGGAKKRSVTTLPCLKTLTLTRIDLSDGIMLSCALELIRSFPNLHTLEIKTNDLDDDPPPAVFSPDVDYDTMVLLLQLQRVMFTRFQGLDNEVCLIKYLLACSPALKQMVVRPYWMLDPDEMLMCARKLLKLRRASPIAEIDL